MQQPYFVALLTVSLAVFAYSCYRRLSVVGIGEKEQRFDQPMARVREMLVYAFGQKRVVSGPFGLNHGVIFWSFLVLALANLEFLIAGVIPSLTFARLPHPVHAALTLLFEMASLAVLVAVLLAAVRRTVNPPFQGARTFEAYFILGMIALLMVAFFGMTAAEIALGRRAATATAPVSGVIATLLARLPVEAILPALPGLFWWTHAAVLLGFMNFLPYSKHMHILTAIPNVYLKNLGKSNTQPRELFEEGRRFGAGHLDGLSWKDLFDVLSCTECGRCQKVCPAASTGKALNPRELVHGIKEKLSERKSTTRVAGEGACGDGALWSCTSCGACMEACPVFIEHLPKIVKMRRHLVEMEAKFPEELLNFFENVEQRSNPWGMAPSERSKWSSQLDLKPFREKETEYLLFVGCSGAFDARNKQVSVSLTRVLDAAGVSYGVLGKEEKCCGESVRRLGNEFLFDQMARESVQQLASKGVRKVITQCPHCFSTLKNDFRQFGAELEVVHHSELIKGLIDEGRLELNRTDLGKVIFHDSCYLGRHNDVYHAPRAVLGKATGAEPAEFERNREGGFCCGAGGGRMWLEEHEGTPINRNRVKEALDMKPQTICVSCPFCMTMFEDGLKEFAGNSVQVKDLAEVVAQGLGR